MFKNLLAVIWTMTPSKPSNIKSWCSVKNVFFSSISFCERHGSNQRSNIPAAPTDLMCVAEAMMPRIIQRLIQHLRENSRIGTVENYKGAIQDADEFITMLLDFNNMGGLMRKVITSALTNPQVRFFLLLYNRKKFRPWNLELAK